MLRVTVYDNAGSTNNWGYPVDDLELSSERTNKVSFKGEISAGQNISKSISILIYGSFDTSTEKGTLVEERILVDNKAHFSIKFDDAIRTTYYEDGYQRYFLDQSENFERGIHFIGNKYSNVIDGNIGNDRLDGGGGADVMSGYLGNDTYFIDNEQDQVYEYENGGNDSIYSSLSVSLSFQENNMGDVFDTYVENLFLTGDIDIDGLGSASKNTLKGNSGNNFLYGAEANDILFGGNGNDRLDGGSGADRMEGGSGNDIYIVDDVGDRIVEQVRRGNDTVRSYVSENLPRNVEKLFLLDDGNLKGTGNDLDNLLRGNRGNNTLDGKAGNDTIQGGEGRDRLIGNLGLDTMTGGEDADSFVFRLTEEAGRGAASDVITDFESALDKIDLTAVDADTGLNGDQAFIFIGPDAYSGSARELRFSGGRVAGDVDGDGVSDFAISLTNASQVTEADFLL